MVKACQGAKCRYYHDYTENSAFKSFESRSSFSVTWICFFFWSSARSKISKAALVPSMAKVAGSWAVSFNPAAVSWIQPRITAKGSKSEKRWWKDMFSRKLASLICPSLVAVSISCSSSTACQVRKKLEDGWPESVEEHSESCKYEDLIARSTSIEIYNYA